MRKYIIWGLLLLCMVQSATAKDKKPVTPKEKQPLAYEAFFKGGMKKIGDVLPLYTDGKKYYLEIGEDVLGTDLLVSGTILTGFWPGTVSEVTDMLRFTLGRNHQLEVVQRNLTDRVDENTEPGLAAAVEQSNMESVKFSYPIHAFGDEGKGYIIDITADVNKSGKIFGFPKLQWVNRPVENRMMVDTICPITNGFKILQSRSQTDITPGGMGMPCRITHNTADIEWTIQRLPKLHMPVREADARVGYNTISYNDYSKDPATVNKTTIIRRWNLEVKKEDEKAYNRGVLVEPANPIRVYLNESFPEEFRQVAEQAVREWDAAFASAGFKNVLQLVDKVEATWEYHQIYCWMVPSCRKIIR